MKRHIVFKHSFYLFLCLTIFGQNSIAISDIYSWVDEKGAGHHSNMPLSETTGKIDQSKVMKFDNGKGQNKSRQQYISPRPNLKNASMFMRVGKKARPILFYPSFIQKGSLRTIDHLLFNGGDSKILNHHGATPLMIAVEKGKTKNVKREIEKGADLDAVTDTGITALMLAAKYGRLEIVKFLISEGAGIDSQSYGPMQNLPPFKGYGPSMQSIASLPFETNPKKYNRLNNGFTPLGLAVANGYEDIVAVLVSKGADVNRKSFGASPLAIALYYGYPDICLYFINKGANIKPSELMIGKAVDLFYESLDRGYWGLADLIFKIEKRDLNSTVKTRYNIPILHYYAGMGRTHVIKYLSKKGADIKMIDKNGMTPILYAAWKGKFETIKILLDLGADINSSCNPPSKNFLYENAGASPLILALKKRHFDLVAFLINQGSDCSIADKNGVTPLMLAASMGLNDIVKQLIDHNADVNAKDTQGRQSIMYAVNAGYRSTIDILIRNGANIHSKTNKGEGVIVKAIRRSYIYEDKNFELVDYLISQGADINAKDLSGSTVLLEVIRKGFPNIVSYLIRKGADLELGNKSGQTPLIIALKHGEQEIVEMLVNRGIDTNKADNRGKTPLEYAINNRGKASTILLLKNGAEVNVTNDRKESLLIVSINRGMFDFAKLYIQHGADINLQDKGGRTALMFASIKGNLDMVKTLVENGANVNVKTKYDSSAYIMAKVNKHEKIALFLEKNGADIASWEKLSDEIKLLQEMGLIPKNRETEKISPAQLILIKQFLKKQGIIDISSWKPDKKFSSPEKTWNVYQEALKEGKFDLALSCLEPNLAKIRREEFNAIGHEKIKKMFKKIQPMERISCDEKKAKYRIKKQKIKNGKKYNITYYIYFINIFGEWKIREF